MSVSTDLMTNRGYLCCGWCFVMSVCSVDLIFSGGCVISAVVAVASSSGYACLSSAVLGRGKTSC